MSSASGTDEFVYIQLCVMFGAVPTLTSRSSFEPPVVNTVAFGSSWIQSHACAALFPVQFGPEQGFGSAGVGEPLACTAVKTWLQSSPATVLNVSWVTYPLTPDAPCEAADVPSAPRVIDE